MRCLRFVDPGLISNRGSLISIPRAYFTDIYTTTTHPLSPPLPPLFFPQATMLPRLVRPTATTFHVLARRSLATSAVLAQVRHSLPSFTSPPPPSAYPEAHPQQQLKKTPLYDFHVQHKAKMVPFAGYSMPLSYGETGQSECLNR